MFQFVALSIPDWVLSVLMLKVFPGRRRGKMDRRISAFVEENDLTSGLDSSYSCGIVTDIGSNSSSFLS